MAARSAAWRVPSQKIPEHCASGEEADTNACNERYGYEHRSTFHMASFAFVLVKTKWRFSMAPTLFSPDRSWAS